jgi:membrane-bound lytic murein transglycosylase F
MTSRGLFDCAFAEDLEGSYFLRAYPNVLRVGPVTNRYTLNWVLRPEQQELRNLMQQWFQKATRQDDIMRIQDHYRTFLSSLDVQDVRHFTERIHYVWPEYKASFKSAARHYELDWRLLGAIAFQESHWEPEARSYTGVRGLMQLTSTTAELAGIEDRTDPQESIWGGAYYFKYLYDRLPSELHVNDRTALALAAYNLGYGHLMDAQKLAVKEGRNPNSWRDIRAMLPHLADPAYSDQLDFGPARGQEALDFVERVRGYYSLWRSLDS